MRKPYIQYVRLDDGSIFRVHNTDLSLMRALRSSAHGESGSDVDACELARRVGVTKATLYRCLARAEESGLIEDVKLVGDNGFRQWTYKKLTDLGLQVLDCCRLDVIGMR